MSHKGPHFSGGLDHDTELFRQGVAYPAFVRFGLGPPPQAPRKPALVENLEYRLSLSAVSTGVSAPLRKHDPVAPAIVGQHIGTSAIQGQHIGVAAIQGKHIGYEM